MISLPGLPDRPLRRTIRSAVRALPLFLLAALPVQGQDPSDGIRNRMEAGRASGAFWAENEPVLATRALPVFYERRAFQPAWFSPAGSLMPRADTLLAVLAEAGSHGLEAADYHGALLAEIRGRLRTGTPAWDDRVAMDLLLTDAFLVYGSHLLLGRVDPTRVEAEWLANRRSADLVGVLEAALADGRIRSALEALAPAQPEYGRLRQALASLREVQAAGGWGTVAAGPTLREGDEGPRVAQLRRRLALSTEPLERSLATEGDSLDAVFTSGLSRAVTDFQERHGLEADGAVGTQTLAELNVSVEVRVRQIVANMERWRWLPAELGRRHIRVNIAGFQTEVREEGAVVLRLRSVVGREYRQTPSFSAAMRYLVLAPYWHVPPTIAAQDKLPEIRRDPGYIRAQRMTLLDMRSNEPVDPGTVDWQAMTGPEFNRRYRLRQDPGPTNALGDVKFMFPNRHHVYLHDTPSRTLFARARRDFSSGCVRLENPLALAEYLLGGMPGWSPARIREVVAGAREQAVNLPEPIPVHLLYLTAFVDDQDRVNFRTDIYGRDGVVMRALEAEPPGP